jgi:hypothetical protein
MRGYEWKTGSLLVTDSPASMAEELINQSSDPGRINYWKEQTRMVATSGLAEADLARRIQYTYQ